VGGASGACAGAEPEGGVDDDSADASAGAESDADAEDDASAGSSAGFGLRSTPRGGAGVVAGSVRVHATKTSATQGAMTAARGLTDRQRKPAFVLVEHPIVSLLTFPGSRPPNGFAPTGPRGTKPA
jgi:hypothetical protein